MGTEQRLHNRRAVSELAFEHRSAWRSSDDPRIQHVRDVLVENTPSIQYKPLTSNVSPWRKVVGVYRENQPKYTGTLCGRNADL
jgi:hypothetical protein